MQTGLALEDLPLHALYEVAYAEMVREVETLDKDRHEALLSLDRSIREAEPDEETGLPSFVSMFPSADQVMPK